MRVVCISEGVRFKELLRPNDLVLLSWIRSVLDEAGIEFFIADTQMSVLEGSANAIPRRVMGSYQRGTGTERRTI